MVLAIAIAQLVVQVALIGLALRPAYHLRHYPHYFSAWVTLLLVLGVMVFARFVTMVTLETVQVGSGVLVELSPTAQDLIRQTSPMLISALLAVFVFQVNRLVPTEQSLARLLVSVPPAEITTDGTGCVLAWDIRATHLFGYKSHEALGRMIDTLIIPEHLVRRHREGLQRYVTGGPTATLRPPYPEMARDKEGREFAVMIGLSAVWSADGEVRLTAHIRRLHY